MSKTKAIVGVCLIFLLGGVTGGIATHLVYSQRMESFIKGGTEPREQLIVARLTRKLSLDNSQQEQVRLIVHENRDAIRRVKKQYQPEIEAVLEQGQARIAALLRPDQQETFRKLIAERKQRHHGEEPKH
jgi:hypothetical protein